MTERVLHRHIRELGYCNRGSREWFARHGLDWAAFLREGIDIETLQRIGDGMALRAIEHARADGNGRQITG